MKTHFTATFVLFFIILTILAGCGGDGGQTSSASAVAASQMCIGCHAGNSANISPVTGESITVEWQRSIHKSANGAGCYDCHAQPHAVLDCLACHTDIHKTHANSCGQCHGGSTNITNCRNCHAMVHTGSAKQCLDCHSALGAPHFNSNNSGVTHNAQFMESQDSYNCRNCHNPHDNTVLPAAKAWATSAHGDVKGPAWTAKDFKADKDCLRCHTATGFAGYVTTKPAFTPPTAPQAASPSYGVLGCNACHKNYNFTNHTSVRKIAAYTAPYNSNLSPKTFPNVGDSNLCIPCHSGRESGDAINVNAVPDFSNASFINSHSMAAAATMYLSNAFINFTTLTAPAATSNEGSAFASNKSYAQTLLPADIGKGGVGPGGVAGGVTSTHRALGTSSINQTETYLKGSYAVANNSINTNGPCVTCHMQADRPVDSTGLAASLPAVRTGAGHSLKIDNDALTQLCVPCHAEVHLDGGDGAGNAIRTQLTKDTIPIVMLEPQSAAFQNGLNLVKQLLLVKYMIKYDPTAEPYFFDLQKDATGKTAVTDWTRKNVAGVSNAAVNAYGTANFTVIPVGGLTQIQASRLMGACFNLNLQVRDPGGFVHARTFSQRLVYDSVDYLDNNLMDFTALSTARIVNPAIYHGTNRNVFASDGTLATESMAWLSGTHYTDTNGAKPPVSLQGTNTLYPLRLRP